nr:PQQ-binding-like beta-propeller repeat protein [Actinomycetota bacterium]
GLDPTNPDPARQAVLYFGTADCPDNSPAPCPSAGSDPYCPAGQNYDYSQRWQPYAESMTAISAVGGTPLWSFQGSAPLNQNDDDYGPSAQLFSLPSGRPVVGEAKKDGTYAVLDRATGAPIWHQAETGNGNLKPGFALGGFIGTTAVLGVDGAPRVFGAAAINTPLTYDPASGNPQVQPLPTLQKGLLAMRAFSATTGQPAWAAPELYTYGPTSAANGVVYSGSLDGFLRAFDAKSGALLWAFPLGAPISSGATIGAGTVVIGGGTSESDVEFKTCADLPGSLAATCAQTPLNQTVNPLSKLGSISAFSVR